MKAIRSLLIFSFLVSVGSGASQFESFNFEFTGCSKGSNSINNAQLSKCSSFNLVNCIEGSFIIENTHGDKFVATHFKDGNCEKPGNKIKFECSQDHGVKINNGYYSVTCFKNIENIQKLQKQQNEQQYKLESNKNQFYYYGNDSSNSNITSSTSNETVSSSSSSNINYSSYDSYSYYSEEDYSDYNYDLNELAPEGSLSYSDSIFYDFSFRDGDYNDKSDENSISLSSNNNDQQPVNYLNNNNFKMNKILDNNENNQNNVNYNNQKLDQNKINSENVHTQYSDSLYASSVSYDSLDPDHNSLTSLDYREKINETIQDYRKTHPSGETTNIPSSTTSTPTVTPTATPTQTSRPTSTPSPTQTEVPTQSPIDTETPAQGTASSLVANLSFLLISILLINLLL